MTTEPLEGRAIGGATATARTTTTTDDMAIRRATPADAATVHPYVPKIAAHEGRQGAAAGRPRAAAPAPTTGSTSSSTTSREPAAEVSSRRRWMALGLLVSAQFVVMLDTSIVNVALPSIQDDLELTPAGVAWVVNAYVLTFGGLLLLAGRFADVLGRRRMFVVGSAVVTAGTLVAGTADGAAILVAARVVQGAGAAALSPAAMSLLLVTFPGAGRARAMSAWGAASTLGGAAGVTAGGLISGTLGWSWVFYATAPVTLVAMVAAPRLLEGAPARVDRRFDVVGAATVTGAVLVLVHGALSAPQEGWTSPSVLGAAAVAAVLLSVFVIVERRVADPLVPMDTFAPRAVSTGVLLAVLGGAARASTFVLLALYLQQGLQLAPQAAGLAMLPTSLAGFAVSVGLLPRALRALGPERSLTVGLVILAAGHLWLARTPTEARYLIDVLPALLLVAAGVALSFTPTTMVIAAAVPATRAGLASGLASSATQVGSALGLAAFTAVAVASTDRGAASGAVSVDGFAAAFAAAGVLALTTAAVALTLRGSARQAVGCGNTAPVIVARKNSPSACRSVPHHQPA